MPYNFPGPKRSPVSDMNDAAMTDSLTSAVDRYLADWIDRRPLPANLREAIRYSLLGPGKRTRPILVLRSCEAVGGTADQAMPAAAAIEMIHAFSLVHDDLPAMDDDDLRRGRPTLHRHAGEAMAILAGDALMGLAFELISDRVGPAELSASVTRELVLGCNNMIAGQVYDSLPEFDESIKPLERLQTIHGNKTGALIRAACRMGGLCGGGDEQAIQALTRYGESVGLMFQVVDDLLDVTRSTEQLGKTAGKDVDQQKVTYPSLMGIDASRVEVRKLQDRAVASIEGLGERARPLRNLCEYLAARTR